MLRLRRRLQTCIAADGRKDGTRLHRRALGADRHRRHYSTAEPMVSKRVEAIVIAVEIAILPNKMKNYIRRIRSTYLVQYYSLTSNSSLACNAAGRCGARRD
jgi:hypothetical protein